MILQPTVLNKNPATIRQPMVLCDVAPMIAILDKRDQSSMLAEVYSILPSIWSVGVFGTKVLWGLSRLFFSANNPPLLPINRWMSVVMPYENL